MNLYRACTSISVTFLSIFLLGLFIISCKKEAYISSPDALLFTSADTLHFDTVFTSVGSVTLSCKIFNPNDQKLKLSKIELMGGTNSFFSLNVNGSSGHIFTDIDIAANDSIYLFSTVTINPNLVANPFVVMDSISIQYNNNEKFIQLAAFGKNAHFLNNVSIANDTIWSNELPFVIMGSFNIQAGAKLEVNAGVQIYCHGDAAFTVHGTLKTNGAFGIGNQVVFSGDRLDEPYVNYPGSWQGIVFSASSIQNILQHTIIKNAYDAVHVTGEGENTNIQVSINECIIDNAFRYGLYAENSYVSARNSLISNCGLHNVQLTGGKYAFTHCTLPGYSTDYLFHGNEVLSVTDKTPTEEIISLQAKFTNCVIYGENGFVTDEIETFFYGNDANIVFENVLFKGNESTGTTFLNSIQNLDPLFASIHQEDELYDFRLLSGSPCIDAGIATGVLFDLDGNLRNINLNKPDMGCYESE